MGIHEKWNAVINGNIKKQLLIHEIQNMLLNFEECDTKEPDALSYKTIMTISENLNGLITTKPTLGADKWFVDNLRKKLKLHQDGHFIKKPCHRSYLNYIMDY